MGSTKEPCLASLSTSSFSIMLLWDLAFGVVI